MEPEQPKNPEKIVYPCPPSSTGQHELRINHDLSSPAKTVYYCVHCVAEYVHDRVEEEIRNRQEQLLTSKK